MLPVSIKAIEGGVDAEETKSCVVCLFTLLQQLHKLTFPICFRIPPTPQSSSEETTSWSVETVAFARPLDADW